MTKLQPVKQKIEKVVNGYDVIFLAKKKTLDKKNEELILVLEGYAEVEAEKLDRQRITTNNAVYIPPFTKHNVFNIGSKLLRYIYIVTSV